MKTISSAVSRFVLKTFMGAALTTTIVIATYKALNAVQSYFAPFAQSALFELACYVPIILFCYWILYLNTRSILAEAKKTSEKTENQSDILIQNLISRFTLGFIEGYETQARQQQTKQQNPNEQNELITS